MGWGWLIPCCELFVMHISPINSHGQQRLCTFGTIFGSICSAYMSTFGALSGNRTVVVARFAMGYWPAKLAALFNIVINVGYGLIDCVVSGQILSAVSGGTLSPIVGIIVTALITWAVSTFGIKLFHPYQG